MSTTKSKKSSKPKSKQATPKRAEVKHQRPRPAVTPEVTPKPEPKPVSAADGGGAKPKRVVLKPMQLTDRITAVAPCPYKDGTKSAINYARYMVGMTVEEALKAGCPCDYIAWDRRYGYLTIGPAE